MLALTGSEEDAGGVWGDVRLRPRERRVRSCWRRRVRVRKPPQPGSGSEGLSARTRLPSFRGCRRVSDGPQTRSGPGPRPQTRLFLWVRAVVRGAGSCRGSPPCREPLSPFRGQLEGAGGLRSLGCPARPVC